MIENDNFEQSIINTEESLSNTFTDISQEMSEKQIEKITIYNKICCIELINNNHIYIKYKLNWKISDLIIQVIKHIEFKKLYNQRNYLLSSKSHLSLFDLHLALYRSLKSEVETKIDFNLTLKNLYDNKLLKNHKYPFFIFKDNKNKGNLFLFHEDRKEKFNLIQNNQFENFIIYDEYLPRTNIINLLNFHPELEDYYQNMKKGINSISPYKINKLISEKENLDWFIYDDESMNFLKNWEKYFEDIKNKEKLKESINFNHNNNNIIEDNIINNNKNNFINKSKNDSDSDSNSEDSKNEKYEVKKSLIRYLKRNKNKIFLEDYNDDIRLKKEYSQNIYISVTLLINDQNINQNENENEINTTSNNKNINDINNQKSITKKFKISSTTTGRELLTLMNRKVTAMDKKLQFNPDNKILKVKSLNDYIINIDYKLSQFSYIYECIKSYKEPEYIIVDSPFEEKNGKKNYIDCGEEELSISVDSINEINTSNNFSSKGSFLETSSIHDINQKNIYVNKILNIASHVPVSDKNNNIVLINNNENNNKNIINENNNNLDNFVSEIINDINNNLINEKSNAEYNCNNEKTSSINEINNTFDLGICGIDINNKCFNKEIYENNHLIYINKEINNTNNLMKSIFKNNNNNSSKIEGLNLRTKAPFFNKSLKLNKKENEKNEPNIFLNKNNPPIISLLNDKYIPINLHNIFRPFSILFKDCYLKQFYNSTPNKKTQVSVLLFKFQIYCGAEQFSKPVQIKWIYKKKTNYSNIHPIFNKRIYFNVNYNTLPTFASLLIKIKHNIYDNDGICKSNNTIAWCNFKLFDHNKNLMTGIHKLNLNENKNKPFNDESYYYYVDNNSKDNDYNEIFFEIETFSNNVFNSPIKIDSFKIDSNSLMINPTEQIKIEEIKKKTPFDDLNNYDREILWNNRYNLAKIPSVLPKLLSCINYRKKSNYLELEKILKLAKKLRPIESMELLTGKFLHESIRKFAVKCLSKGNIYEIQLYLIQLMQCLKYEMYHDNELAVFLLKLAIKCPLTIGHCLFWSLRSEMYNQNVQQRFGLYLQLFLNYIDKSLLKVFENENIFIEALIKISKIPKSKNMDKKRIETLFFSELQRFNDYMKVNNLEISLPLNFKMRFRAFDVLNCKIMKSKKKPLLLLFKNSDINGEDLSVLFKNGDDLRMDIVTLQLFKIMQTLWLDVNLKLKMTIYNVISTGRNIGMLEIVRNSYTLAQIHKIEGGAFQSFLKGSLKQWMNANCLCDEYEYTKNFLLSNVAYCVATYVLGIGDRHSDNIMIKRNGEILHIDFGHFLGHFKYKMGIKRERYPFVFTKQFKYVLDSLNTNELGETVNYFNEFKEKFWQAYRELRKHSNVIVSLLRILICAGVEELKESSIKYIDKTLKLNTNNEEAEKFLQEKLQESINSWSININNWIHVLVNK